MEQHRGYKLLAAKPLNVFLIFMNIVCCCGIVVMFIVAALQIFDSGFCIAVSIIALIEVGIIWITLEMWEYIKIDEHFFELYNYRKVYRCNIDEIEQVELRTDHRGAKFIVIHPKHPIYRHNRKGKKYLDSKREIVLIDFPKVSRVIKECISEEKVPYIKKYYCTHSTFRRNGNRCCFELA